MNFNRTPTRGYLFPGVPDPLRLYNIKCTDMVLGGTYPFLAAGRILLILTWFGSFGARSKLLDSHEDYTTRASKSPADAWLALPLLRIS